MIESRPVNCSVWIHTRTCNDNRIDVGGQISRRELQALGAP
jgi:hypothetical protein